MEIPFYTLVQLRYIFHKIKSNITFFIYIKKMPQKYSKKKNKLKNTLAPS